MTKTKAERSHFNTRCLERLGSTCKQKDLRRLLREGKLEFVERQSNRVTVWRKDDVVFVYDKNRKTFVTALPYSTWANGRDGDGKHI